MPDGEHKIFEMCILSLMSFIIDTMVAHEDQINVVYLAGCVTLVTFLSTVRGKMFWKKNHAPPDVISDVSSFLLVW